MSMLAFLCVVLACGAQDPAEESGAEEGSGASSPNAADLRDLLTSEAIGETAEASVTGDACRASCAAGYAALCYRITAICATATVVTIGGTIVQCSVANAAACIGGASLSAVCGGRCPP